MQVNWQEVLKPGYTLKEGDMISVRGKGRCQVSTCAVSTKAWPQKSYEEFGLQDMKFIL